MSKVAVFKAIESKRITAILDERGRRMIDADVADIQWACNTNPDQQQRGAPAQFESTQARAAEVLAAIEGKSQPAGTAAPIPDGSPLLVEEKTRSERLRSSILEIDLAEKRGELIRRTDVIKAHASKLMSARDLLEGIPDRVAAKFAAESNPDVVHRLLTEEIRIAMAGVVQLAAEGTH